MASALSKNLPETHRLRPRELFFAFLGGATGAGLGVFWFRLIPDAMAAKGMSAADLSGLAALVTHPGFQIPLLLLATGILSAGAATRMSTGKDRATWILAAGSVLIFATLLLSVNVLYEPVLSESPAPTGEQADDDWED
ncbi:MAG: hypothetical protein KC457_27730 [Myxococcales bacterium]|nr:hypothetical protein [Myxococcales bacterium]